MMSTENYEVARKNQIGYTTYMLTPAQSRAARALINWSQPELAAASGASVSTIRDFETGKRQPIGNNLSAIRSALEGAGVVFVDENGDGPGVRLRKAKPSAIGLQDIKANDDD
jgi:transcriptional regulator with XRE-family HTH domain